MSKKVQDGKLSDFKPTARNSNKHTARGMKALDNSMAEDGYVAPMTAAADGEIIDGDARLETSFSRFGDDVIVVKHDGKKPVIMVREDIPNAEHPTARRIHYRANLTAWQNLALDPETVMADIEAGFDFEAIDIGLPDLGELLDGVDWQGDDNAGADTEPQIDKAEELRVKWGVEVGQLWALGDHRLICGDCTDKAVVERVMGGERADGMITDPPYGVDKAEWDALFPDLDTWKKHKNNLVDGANVVVFPGEANLPYKVGILFSVFDYQWPVIWYKPNAMQFGKTGYSVQSIAWWVSVGKPKIRPNCRDVIVDAIVPKNNDFGHPSPKNINVIEKLVSEFGGDIVFDPYSGSGTTIIACENLGRKARAIEIDAGYVAVALERYHQHTGKQPQLLTD